ncbi:hypothetical protein L3081_14560 [Colwellia sp. MSW7]|uniref:Uncharacterized protein n=1 Tax=Colwellia maritima TaxID=2912588 RepID=A0ABS9X3K3_9GAMM|nr:hypothetical protein [Colwellia maritima]MCI2284382.1 hypothetical protein [Colwellia maritima]
MFVDKTQVEIILVNSLAVIVTTPPHSNLSVTALDYIETALNGVDVIGVFFYQDGVMHADTSIQIASDEFQSLPLATFIQPI